MTKGEENEEFVNSTLNPGALEADLKLEVDAEVRFDSTSRALYTTDASNYRQVPVGIVLPRTPDAVVKTLEICRRHGAPVVSRGGAPPSAARPATPPSSSTIPNTCARSWRSTGSARERACNRG